MSRKSSPRSRPTNTTANQQGCQRQAAAELLQPALQRGPLLAHRLQHFGDVAQLGAHAVSVTTARPRP